MAAPKNLPLRAGVLSVLLFLALLGIWYVATAPAQGGAAGTAGMTPEQIEYAKMMGKDPGGASGKSGGFPTPQAMGATVWSHLSDPFYDNGPNDKGIAIQLGYSLARVALGFGLACLVAIPLGFVIGMSPLLRRALDPFIQVLKPISPLAWMPLALYTIKDSSISGIFVIFICSVWPMLVNTAFGVASVKRDWLNVSARSSSSCPPPRPPSSRACASAWASPGWSSWRPRCWWAARASATSCGTSGTTCRSPT
jgi:nitrate/nitrite transport system permease protein